MLIPRPLQFKLSAAGAGSLDFELDHSNVIWDIQMISVQAANPKNNSVAQIFVDGFFACATSAGGADTAQGPPDIYLSPGMKLTIKYSGGNGLDTIVAVLYYIELDRSIAI